MKRRCESSPAGQVMVCGHEVSTHIDIRCIRHISRHVSHHMEMLNLARAVRRLLQFREGERFRHSRAVLDG